jgi:hypothetical protein
MSKHKSKRSTRRTSEQWQKLIDHYNANPIDPQTYCQRIGVTMDRFKIWQQRFEQSGFVEVKPALAPDFS